MSTNLQKLREQVQTYRALEQDWPLALQAVIRRGATGFHAVKLPSLVLHFWPLVRKHPSYFMEIRRFQWLALLKAHAHGLGVPFTLSNYYMPPDWEKHQRSYTKDAQQLFAASCRCAAADLLSEPYLWETIEKKAGSLSEAPTDEVCWTPEMQYLEFDDRYS